MNEKHSIEGLGKALSEVHRIAFVLWADARNNGEKNREEVDFLGWVNRQINKVETAVSRHRRGQKFARIQIDWEHCDNRWWQNGGHAIWEKIVDGHACTDSVTVPMQVAEDFIKEGAKIPGWEDGPFVITGLN